MVGERIRNARLAKGLTLDELATLMDGQVTKQALSKYELGKALPRPRTLLGIAKALGVRTSHLLSEPEYVIECLQYRTRAPLHERSKERVEAALSYNLERRLSLEDRLGMYRRPKLPKKRREVQAIEDAEMAASTIRKDWDLGAGPIPSLIEVLERQSIHVFEIPGEDDFDGLAAIAREEGGGVRAVGIAENPDSDGDRQRLNLAHELGHVVLDSAEDLDEEDVAMRFAGALLVPASLVTDAVGEARSEITLDELIALKRTWGASIQCILHRLRDLDVITEPHYNWWRREIAALGYQRVEPLRLPREQSSWELRNVARAQAEGLMSREQASTYLGAERSAGVDGIDRRALAKLSLEDRRAVLRSHAEKLASYYTEAEAIEWLEADLSEP